MHHTEQKTPNTNKYIHLYLYKVLQKAKLITVKEKKKSVIAGN